MEVVQMTETVNVDVGDTVVVHIPNDAPIGGDTQMTSFTAEEVTHSKIEGTDETWGDTCVVDLDSLTFSDGAKSGDVADISVVGDN